MMVVYHKLSEIYIGKLYKLLNAKLRIFSLSYAVLPSSLGSVLFIDPYLNS